MRYIWDRFDDYFGAETTGWLKRRLALAVSPRLRRWDVRSSDRVDVFVCNSEFVRGRVKNYYSRPAAVVHPFADTDFYTPGPAASGRGDYFLAVSAMVPYKRIGDIVEAFRGLPERVVIVGDGPEKKKLIAAAPPNVEFPGWVSGDRLREYYRNCKALIFPGVEDFGIVPVEAQACGRPVIALAEGGALETVDGPILGVDPLNRVDATGLFYPKPGSQQIAEAVAGFGKMKFDSDIIRAHAVRFSRDAFVNSMRNLIEESYEYFRAHGWAGLEERSIAQKNVARSGVARKA
jgi:glycosyltransferase involved in cell wall biosynthesis